MKYWAGFWAVVLIILLIAFPYPSSLWQVVFISFSASCAASGLVLTLTNRNNF